MTEISAAVNPDRASVALTLTPSESVASVMRHDSNGIQPVRFPSGTFPTTRAVQVDDWEASLAGPVTYRAGEASITVSLAGTGPWLTPPKTPSASVPLGSVIGYDAARSSSSAATPLASGASVVKLGAMGLRSGSFVVLCADHAVSAHLEDLLARYPMQLLRVPEHTSLDLYFLCTGTKVAVDAETGLWTLTVEYVETAIPTDGLPTWTYAALAAAYPDLGTASAAYSSLAGVATNDRSL